MSVKCKNILVVGDININVLKLSKDHESLKNMLKSHNMKYLVDFPTRVCGNSESAIDNFLTNIPKQNTHVTGCITLLSDHDGQILELLNTNSLEWESKKIKKDCRTFSQSNILEFSKHLAKETWESVYTAPVEDKFNTFYNIFIYYFNISFPLRTIQKTIKKNNWLTDSLKLDKQEIVKLARQARFTKENKLNNIIKEKNRNTIRKL